MRQPNGTSTHQLKTPLAMLCCLVLFSPHAAAIDQPTEAEWLSWPEFCRSGFLGSQWGKDSRFRDRNTEATAASLRMQKTTVGIPGVHHFCLGMIHVNRAKSALSGESSRALAKQAIDDIEYSFSRMTAAAPRYSLVTAYYGMALYRYGKRREAMEMWNRGIEAKPASRESYLAMAEALIGEKKAKEALAVLLRYEERKESDAPDAEAFLAHTYLELGMHDKAREHADRAYAFGYPLPGLRNRIERQSK